ncbi:gamma-glutamyl-gamma-aminobutyrate hydrolase family protein [Streptomyces sp. WM6386]|uniref:gamma-glutamyl-gamma-aminobutyrate hydrolase family protein n=1 Tax=Streptomyces sp. WM6386 TaxID=1415558 RepID=UPI000619DEAF|nr:gamma-glutamyl-gamma-aminobutyrate hydrolase family protein [Streptomyces sp. WM6386]
MPDRANSAHPPDLPVVGVLACRKQRANGTSYSRVNDVLTDSLLRYARVLPLVVPPDEAGAAALDDLDGLVLPGSGSFVHPRFTAEAGAEIAGREYDTDRDAAALALLRRARELPDLPVLGSCRGMQEIGVAAGASLRDTEGAETAVHRFTPRPAGGDRWADAHPVHIRPGGLLAGLPGELAGTAVPVNSQHSQVVCALPDDVRVEAVAPDGVLEAISVGHPARYVLGIQWHFEQHTGDSALNRTILESFGRRCRLRREKSKSC